MADAVCTGFLNPEPLFIATPIRADRQRLEKVARMRREGKTYREIGLVLGISTGRAQRIGQKLELEGWDVYKPEFHAMMLEPYLVDDDGFPNDVGFRTQAQCDFWIDRGVDPRRVRVWGHRY